MGLYRTNVLQKMSQHRNGWVVLFSICLLLCLGTGNMPQISSIAVIMNDTFDIPKYITGAVLAVLLGGDHWRY